MAIACPTCKTQMKDLFTGVFCPNDCDRPSAKKPSPGYLLRIEELRMLGRKIPYHLRDGLTDALVGLRKGTVYWIAWELSGNLYHSDVMTGDQLRKCDWVIFINANGKINVHKNRFGGHDLNEIPDII